MRICCIHKIYLIILFLNQTIFGLQSITNSNLSGSIIDNEDQPIKGAIVIANHIESGTEYGTISNDLGNFYFRNIRPGGPYIIKVKLFGYTSTSQEIDYIPLNTTFHIIITLRPYGYELSEIVVSAQRIVPQLNVNNDFSQNINEKIIKTIPNINNSFTSLFTINPISNNESFHGKNPRFNLISLDGSIFSNSFGLGNTSIIGSSSGAQPLSLDAIESIQFNVAPMDLSQSGFTGVSVNTVTKKGTDKLKLSLYTKYQDENFIRQSEKLILANNSGFGPSGVFGLTASGPIVEKNLFLFLNYERIYQNRLGNNFVVQRGNANSENVTRVKFEDMINLRKFLLEQYEYDTGDFDSYTNLTKNEKFLANIDWNINATHKLNVRYNSLYSTQENNVSNSSFVGRGQRTNNPFSMSYRNSNWIRKGELQSFMLELGSNYGNGISSRISFGYTQFNEKREYLGKLFPLVDILKEGKTYISFGSDPFAPNNNLRTKVIQSDAGISFVHGPHEFTIGYDLEYLNFFNNFTPAWQSVYTFSSLNDFYNSSPIGNSTPFGLSTGTGRPILFQKGIALTQDLPKIKPSFFQFGIFLQDKIKLNEIIEFTIGTRLDKLAFLDKPRRNLEIESLKFQNSSGKSIAFRTDELPDIPTSYSYRFGINLLPINNFPFSLQLGTGLFLGNVPFVYFADQYLNNGILFKNSSLPDTENIIFSKDPNEYNNNFLNDTSPYDLVVINPNFKLPQVWRSTLGLNYIFPYEFFGAFNFIYGKDINAVSLINANLDNLITEKNPIDGRERITNNNLNNSIIRNAYLLQNVKGGNQIGFSVGISKNIGDIFTGFLGYTWSETKEINSLAATNSSSTFLNTPVVGNPNKQVLSFSQFDQPHKLLLYSRIELRLIEHMETAFTIVGLGLQNGRFSYTYSGTGDVNGDGVVNNDLLFVPNTKEQIALETYIDNSNRGVSVEEQWRALDKFISNSGYLNSRRGKFAERFGAILPWYFQIDARIEQKITYKNNELIFSIDVINLTNLLNKNWGVPKFPSNTNPIEATTETTFRVYPEDLKTEFNNSNGINSRWQIQLGLRYSYN